MICILFNIYIYNVYLYIYIYTWTLRGVPNGWYGMPLSNPLGLFHTTWFFYIQYHIHIQGITCLISLYLSISDQVYHFIHKQTIYQYHMSRSRLITYLFKFWLYFAIPHKLKKKHAPQGRAEHRFLAPRSKMG